MSPVPAIDIRGVTKRYGALHALAGIDLEIAQGEFFGLLGPNGAGKTTLISALAGLTRADEGSLAVMGHDVVTDYRAARQRLGVVPQELVFDPFFSVREALRLQSGYFGLAKNDVWIDEILEHLDLTTKADANMRMLSGGMKRRVLVAQALVHRPPVIVLDEPTAGVDVELRQGLWQFIRQLNEAGHTIVLTTHYLEEAQALCQRIAMLKAGRIVALDTTANLIRRFNAHVLHVRLAVPIGLDFLPGAHAVDDGWVEIPFDGYGDVEELLARIRLTGGQVDELVLGEPDLEKVFVGVMNDA